MKNIYRLGQSKAAALPGYHAISGCDCTGSLAGKGKISFWKPFANAPETTISALTNLGSAETQTDEDINELERFICRVYQNNKKNNTLSDLRWMMFRTKQALSEKLPPTRATLLPALKRANYQAMIWFNDIQARPVLPSPVGHGWIMQDNRLVPVMCDLPCAPDFIIQLVRCSCTKNRCVPPCKCASVQLVCTEMCSCNGDETCCDNVKRDVEESETSDSSESDTDDDS